MKKIIIYIILITTILLCFSMSTKETECNPENIERNLPERLRGFNVGSIEYYTPEVIEQIAMMGANVIRWNLKADMEGELRGPEPTKEAPLSAYEKVLAQLDMLLPVFNQYGISLIISLNKFYGREDPDIWELDAGKELREHIIHFWEAFAERYAQESTIIGYDICNEPAFFGEDTSIWWEDILPRSIDAVRCADSSVWFIVEPCIRERENLEEKINSIEDSRCIISFHFYKPLQYTHQGIGPIPEGDIYPGISDDDIYWEKEGLRSVFQDAVILREKTGRRFYVGEFGVLRYAEGREQWIQDTVELWEEYGFDWTVHSLGGWNGWNHTFPPEAPSADRPVFGGVIQESWLPVIDAFKLN